MYKKMVCKALKDVKDNKQIGQRRFFPTNNTCNLLFFIYPKEPALYKCLKNQYMLIVKFQQIISYVLTLESLSSKISKHTWNNILKPWLEKVLNFPT